MLWHLACRRSCLLDNWCGGFFRGLCRWSLRISSAGGFLATGVVLVLAPRSQGLARCGGQQVLVAASGAVASAAVECKAAASTAVADGAGLDGQIPNAGE